jgi:hypothetical protein
MIELIVLVVVLVGLTVIARSPTKKQPSENPTEPPPSFWSTRTDWQRFEKPTYLRRGIVLDPGKAWNRRRWLPARRGAVATANAAERETPCHPGTGRRPPERLRSGARSSRR